MGVRWEEYFAQFMTHANRNLGLADEDAVLYINIAYSYYWLYPTQVLFPNKINNCMASYLEIHVEFRRKLPV